MPLSDVRAIVPALHVGASFSGVNYKPSHGEPQSIGKVAGALNVTDKTAQVVAQLQIQGLRLRS